MTLAIAEGVMVRLYEVTGLKPQDIRERTRRKNIVRARQAMMFALRRRTLWSTTQIGNFLNLKDHTTVLHGVRKVEHLLKAQDEIMVLVDALMKAAPVMPGMSGLHIRAVDEHRALLAPAEPVDDELDDEPDDEPASDDEYEPHTMATYAGIQLGSAKLLVAIRKARLVHENYKRDAA